MSGKADKTEVNRLEWNVSTLVGMMDENSLSSVRGGR